MLGPVGQAAIANVAGKLPGGATALNAYNVLSAGKPAAAVASPPDMPGSLPRSGADVRSSILKKTIL